jgi:hypothetical protein
MTRGLFSALGSLDDGVLSNLRIRVSRLARRLSPCRSFFSARSSATKLCSCLAAPPQPCADKRVAAHCCSTVIVRIYPPALTTTLSSRLVPHLPSHPPRSPRRAAALLPTRFALQARSLSTPLFPTAPWHPLTPLGRARCASCSALSPLPLDSDPSPRRTRPSESGQARRRPRWPQAPSMSRFRCR